MNAIVRNGVRAPIAISRTGRFPVFANAQAATETPEFRALMQQFDGYHAETKKLATSVTAIETDLDEINARFAAMSVGIGETAGRPGNLVGELKALASFVRSGVPIQASMSVGSDPDGGYLVLPAISSTMTKKLFDAVVMRRLSRVETITAGDAWMEPLDIGDPQAVWVGENQARPATNTPTLGMLTIPVPEIYALQPITQRLLDDSGFDIAAWLNGKITDRFARTEGIACINGDGIQKIRGVLSYPIVSTTDTTRPWGQLQYIATGDASIVTADSLRNLLWGLRAVYRAGATFVMNSNTASAIDKLKDGSGDYLWRPSMVAGTPNMLLGFPVEFDENMPDIASNATPIMFGNFKLAYVIVDKAGIRFLTDPFSAKPNVQFYAYRRTGGGVANSEAVKLLKVAVS